MHIKNESNKEPYWSDQDEAWVIPDNWTSRQLKKWLENKNKTFIND